MARSVLYSFLILCFALISGGEVFAGPPHVYMSTDLNGIDKADNFHCRQKVYVHAGFKGLNGREYTASVAWINPEGQLQDFASHKFKGEKETRVWFWLELAPGFGGKLMKGIDPSFGMEGFEGIWKVRLYLDEKTVDEKVFFISC